MSCSTSIKYIDTPLRNEREYAPGYHVSISYDMDNGGGRITSTNAVSIMLNTSSLLRLIPCREHNIIRVQALNR